MRIPTLDAFLSGGYFQVRSTTPGTVESFPYRITALCRASDVSDISALMQSHLEQAFGHVITLQNRPHMSLPLTEIVADISCSIAQRGELVQLVTRLGYESGVRSVRWESVPHRPC